MADEPDPPQPPPGDAPTEPLAPADAPTERLAPGPPPEPAPWTDERDVVYEEEVVEVQQEEVEEPLVEEPPERERPTLWPWLLGLLALVLVALGAVWYFTREDEPELKPVPGVVRLSEGDAVQRLNDEGFESSIEREPSDDAPQGIVYAQTPGAGRSLAEGSTVTIFVSTGAATAAVPDVVGLEADQAQGLLEDAGFEVRRASVFSQEPAGNVVAQDPAGDERAPVGSSVRINVSQGTERVEVPDVVGLSAAEAGATLSGAGLGTPNVVTVPSARPASEVVAQSPAAGSEVERGSSIRINVSDGTGVPPPAEVDVPDVVGLEEEDGIDLLEEAGLTVRIRREETDDAAQAGLIVSQDPEAGQTATPGDEVVIVVAEPPPA